MKFWFGKKDESIDAAADAAVQDVLNQAGSASATAPAPSAGMPTPSVLQGVPSVGVPHVGGLGVPVVGAAAQIHPAENFAANTTSFVKNEKIEPAPVVPSLSPQPAPAAASVDQAAAARAAFLQAQAPSPISVPSSAPPVQEQPRSPTVRLKPLSSIPVPSSQAVKLQPKFPAPAAAPVLTPVMKPAAAPFILRASAASPQPAIHAHPAAAASDHSAATPMFHLHSRAPVVKPVSAAPAAPVVPATAQAAPVTVQSGGDDGVVRPKTDQKALYYQLMNGLYDAVLILDEHGHVVDCNSRCEDILGYKREDMWDLPVDKIITGLTLPMLGNLARNIAEQHHVLMDARCFRRDGSSFAGEVGVSGLNLTRAGKNIVFAIRNIERRKAAMDELRRSQAALEVSLAPTFVCNQDGYFQQTNPALLQAFGIPDEKQAKKVRFMDILPDAARAFLRASCGEKVSEKLQISADGTPVLLTLSLTPIKNGAEITGVAGSIMQ